MEEFDNIKTNDYVIVKLSGKKSVRYFLALIVSCDDQDFTVKYMKKISSNKFVFEGEKLWTVLKNDIIGKLNQPTINNRELYIFNDINKFNNIEIN